MPFLLSAMFFGLVAIGLAFLASKMGTLISMANSIFGALGGPLVGAFLLGMFWRRANARSVCYSSLFYLWQDHRYKVEIPYKVSTDLFTSNGLHFEFSSCWKDKGEIGSSPKIDSSGMSLYTAAILGNGGLYRGTENKTCKMSGCSWNSMNTAHAHLCLIYPTTILIGPFRCTHRLHDRVFSSLYWRSDI